MRRQILVFGANGQIGRETLRLAGDAAFGIGHADADIGDEAAVGNIIDAHLPLAIVNAAAYTAVDKAESEPEEALRVNRDGAANLARAAARAGVPLLHLSTDYVFDGNARSPYREDDPIAPLGAYGSSKAEGEAAVRAACASHVILRTAWVYAPHGSNFVRTMLRLASERDEVRVVDDQIGCPTSATDIAAALLAIIERSREPGFAAWGTYHYCGGDICSWYGFAAEIFGQLAARGRSVPRLTPIATADYPTPAKRPVYSVLATGKFERSFGLIPPPLQQSLQTCLDSLLQDAA